MNVRISIFVLQGGGGVQIDHSIDEKSLLESIIHEESNAEVTKDQSIRGVVLVLIPKLCRFPMF